MDFSYARDFDPHAQELDHPALRDRTIAWERVQVGLCDDHVTQRPGRSQKNNSVWVLVLGVSIVLLCILGFYSVTDSSEGWFETGNSP